MFYQQPTYITTECCKCYQYQETPVPPAIEHIACDNDQQILPTSPTKHKPIEQEHYRQEQQKLERIEEHTDSSVFYRPECIQSGRITFILMI
jgi:hypothetical protein